MFQGWSDDRRNSKDFFKLKKAYNPGNFGKGEK